MVFDPNTLLLTAVLTMTLIGVLMAALSRDSAKGSPKRWWVAAFLLNAVGFAILGLNPQAENPIRIICNMLFLASYASCYNGARATAGRITTAWPVFASFILWPCFVALVDPGFTVRVTTYSLIICGFSIATALEFWRGASEMERSRRIGAVICGLHLAFYMARAALGPTFGTSPSSDGNSISLWAAVVALEGILFASALAVLAISSSLEREGLSQRKEAYTDFLTGIGNRRAFESTTRKIISGAYQPSATLLLLDLDNFKQVNDQLGHEAGDHYLKAFTAEVQALLPDPEMFWRLGGDEFAIILNCPEPNAAQTIGANVRKLIKSSPKLSQIAKGVEVSVSIGSVNIQRGESVLQLVRRSDFAMYQEKNERTAQPRRG